MLSERRLDYIRKHCDHASVAALAAATNAPAELVTKALRGMLEKRPREKVEAGSAPLPPYTAALPVPPCAIRVGALDWTLALLCAFGALAVYLATLPPTVVGEDSGELVTAAYTLGIAHPPGYPLYTMLGKLFTFLPLGSVAWRVSLMSAVFGAGGVFLLFLLTLKVSGSRWGAAVAALMTAFSWTYWEQSVVPEVYTLNAFLLLACLLLLWLWYERRRPAHLLLFAGLYGLSLGNHNTMYLLGPVAVGWVIYIEPYFWRRWPLYLGCNGIALALAALVYSYLPLRSLADPPMDWGNPETFENFLSVVRREQYPAGLTRADRSFWGTVVQIWIFLKLYAVQFTPWLAVLPPLGLVFLFKRDRRAFCFLGSLFLILSAGVVLLLNVEDDRQTVWLSNVFFVPAWILCALFAGVLVSALQDRLGGKRLGTLVLLALLVVCAVSPLFYHFRRNDKSDYFFTADYARNLLATMDQDALYFPTSDHATFPVLYLQAVEGLRPDVTIGDKYGYIDPELYAEMPAELREGFGRFPTKAEELAILHWIIRNTDRPVYFTTPQSLEGLPGHTLSSTGLLYRVVRPDETLEEKDYWTRYTWHTLDPESTHGELTGDYVLGDYYFMRGVDHLAKEVSGEAREAFDTALAAAGATTEMLNNMGSASAEHGALDLAEQYLEQAVALDSEYWLARRNLAKLFVQQGRCADAVLQYEELIKQDEGDVDALRQSARCLVQLTYYDEALRRYHHLTTLIPGSADIWRELGMLYLQHKRDTAAARRYLSKSLQLDPDQPQLAAMLSQPMEASPQHQGQALGPQLPIPPMPTAPMPSAPTPPGLPGAIRPGAPR